jgi:VWA domain-containing protein
MLALSFASPWAALVGLAAAIPLGALVLAARRSNRIAGELGLTPAPGRWLVAAGAIAALAFLVALAAAQPIAESQAARYVRTDAEAWFVIDTSRSMLAAAGPTEPTRFARARTAAIRLRALLSDVPVGVGSLTDRALPNLFPTLSQSAFAATTLRALAIDRPPPAQQGASRSTSMAGLIALPEAQFFSPKATRRLIVALTDGETQQFDVAEAARAFKKASGASYRVLVVHFWAPDEQVFRADGVAESYVPNAAATTDTAQLAAATGGGMFGEDQLTAVAAAAHQFLGNGPRRRLGTERRPVSLAPWLLGLAVVPLGLLLWRRPL